MNKPIYRTFYIVKASFNIGTRLGAPASNTTVFPDGPPITGKRHSFRKMHASLYFMENATRRMRWQVNATGDGDLFNLQAGSLITGANNPNRQAYSYRMAKIS